MLERFDRFTRLLSQTEKTVRRLKMEGIEQFGLKGEQVQLLVALHEHQPLTLKELCSVCGLDAGLISRNLKKLQAQGIIARAGTPGRYRAAYSLTDEGEKIMDSVEKIIVRIQQEAVKDIPEAEMDTFYAVLSRLNENLENLPEDWRKL